MLTLTGLDELKSRIGQEVGISDWHEVTQESVNEFADVTGDHNWNHVDPERAKETPFGGTIAHGYYTLSLAPMFSYTLLSVEGFAFGVNYGLNRVRFPAPLPVGSRVRMRMKLAAVDDVPRRRPVHHRADLRARGRRQAGVRGRVAGAGLHRLAASAVSCSPPPRSMPRCRAGPAAP